MWTRIAGAGALCAVLLTSGCGPALIGGAATAGVAGSQERGFANALADTEINLRLDSRLANDNPALGEIATRVSEGRVVLIGTVPSPELAIRAEEIAWSVPDVRAVNNQLETGRDRTSREAIRDLRIATQARLRLVALDDTEDINYSITVIGGVLSVTGIAQDDAELTRVLDTLAGVPGVNEVRTYVLMKDDPRRTTREAT